MKSTLSGKAMINPTIVGCSGKSYLKTFWPCWRPMKRNQLTINHMLQRPSELPVTRHCTDSHCKRTSSSSRVRASLGINLFYISTCLHVPYPQRVQTICITAPPQPYLFTLGSEEGPQGGRSGTAWVKETFAPLKEGLTVPKETGVAQHSKVGQLRTGHTRDLAGSSQRTSNLRIICKNSSSNEGQAGSADRPSLPSVIR